MFFCDNFNDPSSRNDFRHITDDIAVDDSFSVVDPESATPDTVDLTPNPDSNTPMIDDNHVQHKSCKKPALMDDGFPIHHEQSSQSL